jgi:dihydroorotate dehydrogenase (fumarate)
VAVKLSPFFTSLPNFIRRVVDAGANGVVLFNRFMQPNIDLEHMQVCPQLVLSSPDELRLSMRWIALLYGRIHTSFAATSGVHFADDVIKVLLAGADVAMIASTLYRHGVEILPTLIEGVRSWAEANDFPSVERIKGALSQRRCPDPAVFERANYTQALASFLNETQEA